MTIAITITEQRAKLESFGDAHPDPMTRWLGGADTDLQAGFMRLPIPGDPFDVDTTATLDVPAPIDVGEETLYLTTLQFFANPDVIQLNFSGHWPRDSVEYHAGGSSRIDWTNGLPSEGFYEASTTKESGYLGSLMGANPGASVLVKSIPEASQALCLVAALAAASLWRWLMR